MAEPRRTSPFASVLAEPLPGPSSPGCRLAPLAEETRFLLRGTPEVAEAAAGAIGLDVPAMLRQSRAKTGAMAMLGPDEYLLRGIEAEPITEALADRHHALVDVSHRLTGVHLRGPAAAVTLAGACPLDLHAQIAPVGLATRTVIGKNEIILIRTEADGFDLLTNRSLADYLWHLLLELGREHDLAAEPA